MSKTKKDSINSKLMFEVIYETSAQVIAYNTICDYFGISDEDRKNPSVGEWVVDWVKEIIEAHSIKKGEYETTNGERTPNNPLHSKSFSGQAGDQV